MKTSGKQQSIYNGQIVGFHCTNIKGVLLLSSFFCSSLSFICRQHSHSSVFSRWPLFGLTLLRGWTRKYAKLFHCRQLRCLSIRIRRSRITATTIHISWFHKMVCFEPLLMAFVLHIFTTPAKILESFKRTVTEYSPRWWVVLWNMFGRSEDQQGGPCFTELFLCTSSFRSTG